MRALFKSAHKFKKVCPARGRGGSQPLNPRETNFPSCTWRNLEVKHPSKKQWGENRSSNSNSHTALAIYSLFKKIIIKAANKSKQWTMPGQNSESSPSTLSSTVPCTAWMARLKLLVQSREQFSRSSKRVHKKDWINVGLQLCKSCPIVVPVLGKEKQSRLTF